MGSAFRWVGRRVLVPLFGLRLGWLVANPISGYCMVVRTVGRRSGRPRHATVMYAIGDGCAYAMAGWGPETNWYRNAVADPRVTLLLPGRSVTGQAEEITAPREKAAALRRILRGSGLSAFSEGVNPWRDDDATLLANAANKPVLRVRPNGAPLSGGAFDPGGVGWLVAPALVAAIVAVLAVVAVRRAPSRP